MNRLLVGVFIVFLAACANATRYTAISWQELVTQSDLVLEAVVISAETTVPSGGILLNLKLEDFSNRKLERLKGEPAETIIVRIFSPTNPVRVGGHGLFFLKQRGDDQEYRLSNAAVGVLELREVICNGVTDFGFVLQEHTNLLKGIPDKYLRPACDCLSARSHETLVFLESPVRD